VRVYIAGSFTRAKELRAEALRCGLAVTSSWLWEEEEQLTKHDDEVPDWQKRARAHDDLVDIDRADAVVVFTDVPSTTGGYHVEVGYALGRDIPVVLVGPRLNVFHYDQRVWWFETLEEAARWLKE
jgi:nucleoside 2-deoxyribosyltransferase